MQQTSPQENLAKLNGCYEAVIRSSLDPSSKVIALTLIYQGAFKDEGVKIPSEIIAVYAGLARPTVTLKLLSLIDKKIFTRCRQGNSTPYTYYFNRNTHEWKDKEGIICQHNP